MGERVRYFSNGTEGRMWQAAWCDRCLRDHQFRVFGRGTGCPIFAKAISVDDHREVSEWLYFPEHVTDPARRVTCIEFKPYLHCSECGRHRVHWRTNTGGWRCIGTLPGAIGTPCGERPFIREEKVDV